MPGGLYEQTLSACPAPQQPIFHQLWWGTESSNIYLVSARISGTGSWGQKGNVHLYVFRWLQSKSKCFIRHHKPHWGRAVAAGTASCRARGKAKQITFPSSTQWQRAFVEQDEGRMMVSASKGVTEATTQQEVMSTNRCVLPHLRLLCLARSKLGLGGLLWAEPAREKVSFPHKRSLAMFYGNGGGLLTTSRWNKEQVNVNAAHQTSVLPAVLGNARGAPAAAHNYRVGRQSRSMATSRPQRWKNIRKLVCIEVML